tara:strand:- start:488 stop:1924 length:1437 start_codon:yes stop_codon:yes gene_type:complete
MATTLTNTSITTDTINVDSGVLYVDNTNNRVGVGTASPTEVVEVRDGTVLLASTTTSPSLQIQRNDGSGNVAQAGFNVFGSASNIQPRLAIGVGAAGSAPSAKLFIGENGNVGIGVSNPQRSLVLYDSASAQTQIQFQNSTTGAATGDGFGVGLDSAEKGFIWNYEGNDTYIGGAGGTAITIKNDGKVGIGTTNPPATLSIYGNEATGMGISIHDDGWGGYNGLYMMTVLNSNGAFVVRKNTANALDFSTSENQMEVGTDGIRAIGYGNSATGDNVSVEYTGTAGGHKSGYLFRDKRDVVNAAVKNNLLDDGVGTAAASIELHTSHGGTLTKQLDIDRYGRVTAPNQPSFNVMNTNTLAISGGTVLVFNTTRHNVGNNVVASTGIFTAPVAGSYLFTFKTLLYSMGTAEYLDFYPNVNNSARNRYEMTGTGGDHTQFTYSEVVQLSANDTFKLVMSDRSTGSYGMYGNENHFSGHLLG